MITFLTEALGFEATVVYAEGDTVHHAGRWRTGQLSGGAALVRECLPEPYRDQLLHQGCGQRAADIEAQRAG
jgi:hypothetical protein